MVGDDTWYSISGPENFYQYNGKELNTDFKLDWLDYGARWYDASLARWGAVDPLSEKYSSFSTYNYVLNNPIINIDPDGRNTIVYNENGEEIGRYEHEGDDIIIVMNQEQLTAFNFWKGFDKFLVNISIYSEETFNDKWSEENAYKAYSEFGTNYLVRGEQNTTLEGKGILDFMDYVKANAKYENVSDKYSSPKYLQKEGSSYMYSENIHANFGDMVYVGNERFLEIQNDDGTVIDFYFDRSYWGEVEGNKESQVSRIHAHTTGGIKVIKNGYTGEVRDRVSNIDENHPKGKYGKYYNIVVGNKEISLYKGPGNNIYAPIDFFK